MNERPLSLPAQIALGLALAAAAIALRQALEPWMGTRAPYLPTLAALAVAARFGGWIPAIIIATAGFLAAHHLWINPGGQWFPQTSESWVAGIAYLITAGIIVLLGRAARQAERQRALAMAGVHDQFFTLDRRWRYTSVNAQVTKVTGRRSEELVGREIWELFPELRGTEFERAVRAVAETGEPAHFEHFHAPTGRWFENHVYRNGKGLAFFVTDSTQRRMAEEKLRASEARHRTLAAHLPGGAAFVVNRDLRYELAEGEALRVAGFQPSDLEGRTIHEALPAEVAARYEPYYRRALEGEPFEHEHEDHGRHFLSRGTPLRDADGRINAVLAVSYDITALKAAEEALRTSEQRARLALEVARLGTWSFDPATQEVQADARAREICGILPDEPLTLATLRIHPDDVPRITEAMAAALDPAGDGAYTQELRFVGADGRVHWVVSRAQTFFEPPEPGSPGRSAVVQLGTSHDITPHREAEERLREADRRKDEFLALLGHELRNPLGPIRNAARILEQCPELPEAARQAREIVARQSAHMTRLVDDLLDLSRITSGKLHIVKATRNFTLMVRETVEDYRPMFESSGLTLQLTLPTEPLWVEADAERLTQTIGNVLHNARKFTESPGTVEVTLAREGNEARLEVRDTGIGMDATTLAQLFEPFAQADQSLARSRGGLGLGLALARFFLDLHQGRITAASEGPGRGSRFVVQLPLTSNPAVKPMDPTPNDAGAMGRTVLVIDDHLDTARSLGMLLRHAGHTVHLAHNGPDGVARARENRPDVILCDIGLPGMDGFAVARALRAEPALAEAHLVALSGYAMEEDRRQSEAAGFDLHLAKPIDFSALESVLNRRS